MAPSHSDGGTEHPSCPSCPLYCSISCVLQHCKTSQALWPKLLKAGLKCLGVGNGRRFLVLPTTPREGERAAPRRANRRGHGQADRVTIADRLQFRARCATCACSRRVSVLLRRTADDVPHAVAASHDLRRLRVNAVAQLDGGQDRARLRKGGTRGVGEAK